jgi:hypothetical protein
MGLAAKLTPFMTFSQAVETIRDRAGSDIVPIVADYVQLKRSGSGMKGRCPFHDENTPSFHVSESKQIFKCFGCGVGGDAIDFIERMEGLEFHEVIFTLAERYHISIDNNSRDKRRQQLRTDDSILPGISDLKPEIRKAGTVFLSFNEFGKQKDVPGPKINLEGSLKRDQANLLRKLTDSCSIIAHQLPWPTVKSAIKTLLEADFKVYIVDPSFLHLHQKDWLHYTMPEVGGLVSKQEIIELLAAIPDDLQRDVYTTEFTNLLQSI